MRETTPHFRESFAHPVIQETIRAFLLFSLLLVALLAIGGELAFRQLSLNVLREQIDLGRTAAEQIARRVTGMGGNGPEIDYLRLHGQRSQIEQLIQDQIREWAFVRHVEIRDRFGVRLVMVTREGVDRGAKKAPEIAAAWSGLDREIIQVPLVGHAPTHQGQVLLGISPTAMESDLLDLRRSLWTKIVVAGILALGVLALGLIYVLRLLRRNRELDRARQSAERASYLGLLASGLAHEIRNPLNAMNMNLQMLEEELELAENDTPSESAELLDSTKSEIKRLERLVSDFLAYARPSRPTFESQDLNATIGEVIRLLEADFRQHGVSLESDLEPLLPDVETDESQIKQALINLMVNARQVLGEGGTVTVRTRPGSTGEVLVEIVDDGPGIPEDVQDKIFDIFFSRRGGGTGLGLPIAKQVVERHGGTIEFETADGRGTTFRLRLPRHHGRQAARVSSGAA